MAEANNNNANAIPEDEPALDGYERYVCCSISHFFQPALSTSCVR